MKQHSTPRDTAAADALRDTAAAWLVGIARDPALEQDPALQAWLAADPAHRRAYDDATMAWQIAAALGPELLAETGPEPSAPVPFRPRRRAALWAGGMALAASLLGVAWLNQVRPDLRLSLTADHASRPGELLDFALSDGSRAVLDGGSALDFAADTLSRQVTLLNGAAFFDVGKDGRPFTVRLGQTEIRALGTRFGVRDCGDCVEVSLEEGSISVSAPGMADLILSPGQQLRLIPGEASHIAGQDAPESLGWRDGRYAFYDVTLREVAGVLSRHGAGAVLFSDEALAARKISGSINLGDATSELQALSEVMGFRLITLPGGYLLM